MSCAQSCRYRYFLGLLRFWQRLRGCKWESKVCGSLEEAEKISRMSSISLFDRGCFGHFRVIFEDFGQFRPVFWPIFPFFVLFSTWTHGILASKMRPCTIGHAKTIIKQGVCPCALSIFFILGTFLRSTCTLYQPFILTGRRHLTPRAMQPGSLSGTSLFRTRARSISRFRDHRIYFGAISLMGSTVNTIPS
jgi:hypothetical protein